MNLMEEQKTKIVAFHADGNASDTIPSFLLKTYEILENDKFSDIICWTRTGQGFIVKKIKQFAENVLPIYFRHSNYTSFVRQLNMYDFHKTRQQNHENAFKNLMFKRGSKHLLKDILRKDYKKNKENNKETIATEKNTLERIRDITKNQKQNDMTNDLTQASLNRISELNSNLEKKALHLADIRDIPRNQTDVLKLLDLLFDARKLQNQLSNKLELIYNISPFESLNPCFESNSKMESNQEKNELKAEYPTTESKITLFDSMKDEKMTTYATLFASFRQ